MLKKLLTGCLTIAMIGAFSASVSAADPKLTWSGNVTATLLQSTTKAGDADAVTEMDMYATGDLDLTAEVAGDTWTGTAYLDLDFNSNDADTDPIPTGQSLGIDDLYVKMSNDTMAISFGEFDPVGIGKGADNFADIDETYGAGGLGDGIPNEQGWLMLSLTEVGLDVFIGMNQVQVDPDGTADDGEAATTSFGVIFDKTFGDLALAVEYVSHSFSRDENNAQAIAEDSLGDGSASSEAALAVQYSLSNMGFTLNYTSATTSYGKENVEDLKETWMELLFDMAISDTQGLTASYGMATSDQGEGAKYAQSDIHLSFKLGTGGVNHYLSYWSYSKKEEDADDPNTASKVGYAMKVDF